MKKYIVIALAALVAFAACTKVNPEEKKAEKISFQVATYMTKAQGNNFLAECPNFFTNAWYNPVSGAAQYYMQNVEILPDDNEGTTHQRFLLRLDDGSSLLVAHNTSLAPRLNGLKPGDVVEFCGEFVDNDKGGLVHWTHRDPRGRHAAGWLRHNGKIYE